MKLSVKRVGHGHSETVVHMDADKTVADLKETIGAELNLPTSTLKLISSGKALINGDATLKSYGIEDGATVNVIFTSSRQDAQSQLAHTVCTVLGLTQPPANILAILAHFKYFVTKCVEEDLSLDELEKYAKACNVRHAAMPPTNCPNA